MKITINTHKDSNSFEHLIHGEKIRIDFLFEGELFVYVKYRQLTDSHFGIKFYNFITKRIFFLINAIFFFLKPSFDKAKSKYKYIDSNKKEDKYKTIRKLKFNRGHINTVANFYHPEIQFISVGLFSYNIKNTKLNIELINLINNKVEPKPANIDVNINTKKIAQKSPAGILNVTKQALFKFQKNTIRLPNGKFLLKPTQSKLVIKNNIIETE
jgi:hypothetical protein